MLNENVYNTATDSFIMRAVTISKYTRVRVKLADMCIFIMTMEW